MWRAQTLLLSQYEAEHRNNVATVGWIIYCSANSSAGVLLTGHVSAEALPWFRASNLGRSEIKDERRGDGEVDRAVWQFPTAQD